MDVFEEYGYNLLESLNEIANTELVGGSVFHLSAYRKAAVVRGDRYDYVPGVISVVAESEYPTNRNAPEYVFDVPQPEGMSVPEAVEYALMDFDLGTSWAWHHDRAADGWWGQFAHCRNRKVRNYDRETCH